MVEAAQACIRCHDRFREFYERYSTRKGHQKAFVAEPHEMERIVYFMLKRMKPYRGEGSANLLLNWCKMVFIPLLPF
jgi:hypothetical protein